MAITARRSPLVTHHGYRAICPTLDDFEHSVDPPEAARRWTQLYNPVESWHRPAGFSDGGNHPCHLEVCRFGGGRWETYLAGLGLKGHGNEPFN